MTFYYLAVIAWNELLDTSKDMLHPIWNARFFLYSCVHAEIELFHTKFLHNTRFHMIQHDMMIQEIWNVHSHMGPWRASLVKFIDISLKVRQIWTTKSNEFPPNQLDWTYDVLHCATKMVQSPDFSLKFGSVLIPLCITTNKVHSMPEILSLVH